MKLLTTIAAVLISISAFSQDLIEYNESTYSLNGEEVSLEYKSTMTGFNPNAESMFELSLGTFSRNGEELSMLQINDLTLLHKVGRGNFRRGNRFIRLHKNQNYRITNNIGSFVVGSAAGLFGVPSVVFGGILIPYWVEEPGLPVIFVIGAGLCTVSYEAFSRIASSPEGCLRKRDKQFNKVADKINQAMAAGGPIVQSSNQ